MNIGRIRTLQSPKYANKKRKKLIFLISIIFSTALMVLIILIFALHLSVLRIGSIKISGTGSADIGDIEKVIKDSIEGNYIYVIPKSSFLFYPKSEIKSSLSSKYPEFRSIEMNIKGLSTLIVSLDERKPAVIVCEGFKDDEDTGDCYYADSTGFVYGRIATSTDTNYFKYYINSNSTTTIMGNAFTENSKFLELQKFVKNVINSGIKVDGILISDDNSYEMYIENIDKSDATVYFDDRTPFDKTFSNLVVFWKNSLNKKIGLNVIPNFDYINLRFGNNVFYLIK